MSRVKHPLKLTLLVVLGIAYYLCLPNTIFDVPTATVVESRQGSLNIPAVRLLQRYGLKKFRDQLHAFQLGCPNMTRVTSAAPILFDVFDVLPTSQWFQKPLDEFIDIEVCAQSGYLATLECPVKTISIPKKKNHVHACRYHHIVQLDAQRQFRVNSSCADLFETVSQSWFTLPPLMEFYYKRSHPTYRVLPPFREDCQSTNQPPMAFIYPKNGSRIGLTKNFEGKTNELVLKLAHTEPDTEVYWYLDARFLQQTRSFHEIGVIPSPGRHKITAVDALGNEVSVVVSIE